MATMAVALPLLPPIFDALSSLFGGRGKSKEIAELKRQNDAQAAELSGLRQRVDVLIEQLKAKQINSLEELAVQDKESWIQMVELAKKVKAAPMIGKNAGVFGLVKAGKSTLLNSFRGLKYTPARKGDKNYAEVARGECTKVPTPYGGQSGSELVYWDMPGKHDELNYFTADYISLLKALSQRVIVISGTLKESTGLIKLLKVLGLSMVIVVSKYDLVRPEEQADFNKQIDEEIKEYCPAGTPVFRVSGEEPAKFNGEWNKLINHITG